MGKPDTRFDVGEMLIVHSVFHPDHAKYNGEEVEVVELAGFHDVHKTAYKIRFNDGLLMACEPKNLKRQPPKNRKDLDTPVRWEDCAWKPKEKEANQ